MPSNTTPRTAALTIEQWETLEAFGRVTRSFKLTPAVWELREMRLLAKGIGEWFHITAAGRALLEEKERFAAELAAKATVAQ